MSWYRKQKVKWKENFKVSDFSPRNTVISSGLFCGINWKVWSLLVKFFHKILIIHIAKKGESVFLIDLFQKEQFGSCVIPIFVRSILVGSILKLMSIKCVFCKPGYQTICDSPIRISTHYFRSNTVLPFCLTFHWYSTFEGGKLFVNNFIFRWLIILIINYM